MNIPFFSNLIGSPKDTQVKDLPKYRCFSLVTRKDNKTGHHILVLKHDKQELNIMWSEGPIHAKEIKQIEYSIRSAFSLIGYTALVDTAQQTI